MTEDLNFLNINLQAISKTNLKLYSQIKNLIKSSSNQYSFIQSRTGETVPVIGTQALHSTVDPKREAQRLISSQTGLERQSLSGFLIILGLGGGFIPEAALELTNSLVTVIDFNLAGIMELFSSKDYSHLLKNDRFTILADPSSEEIKSFLTENYKPALYGGIKTIPLLTRIGYEKALFDSVIKKIQEALDIITGDYSVQSHFGKRWFSNIIRQLVNSKNLIINLNDLSNKKEYAIIAAGPSLDIQIKTIAEMKKKGVFIISTDTAFPVLAHNDIKPNLIVSIDCQHISYYHFIGFKPDNIPLILDIASPPALSKLSLTPIFFASGHPLAGYIAQNLNLTLLDTSGANVTYACLSLAEYLGAERITIFGADFSYVNSQSYARGTYIYPYFYKRQNRFSTVEAQFSKFLYRSPFVNTGLNGNNKYFETSSLRFYRKKFEEKISMMQAEVEFAQGMGAVVSGNREQGIGNREQGIGNREQRIGNREQITKADVMEFIKNYRNDILSLPCAGVKENYLKKLNNKQMQVFITLLPFAAFIRKQNPNMEIKEIIEEIKHRSISEIEKIIN